MSIYLYTFILGIFIYCFLKNILWCRDDHVILQAFLATVAHVCFPGFRHLPLWDSRGIVTMALLHMGPTEFLYYWLHRLMHKGYFYRKYHSLHHASVHPEPSTSE